MRLIDADKLHYIKVIISHQTKEEATEKEAVVVFAKEVDKAPTVDAVPVVRCVDCRIHEKCATEDRFRFCGIEDGYCRAGIRKDVFDEVD